MTLFLLACADLDPIDPPDVEASDEVVPGEDLEDLEDLEDHLGSHQLHALHAHQLHQRVPQDQ